MLFCAFSIYFQVCIWDLIYCSWEILKGTCVLNKAVTGFVPYQFPLLFLCLYHWAPQSVLFSQTACQWSGRPFSILTSNCSWLHKSSQPQRWGAHRKFTSWRDFIELTMQLSWNYIAVMGNAWLVMPSLMLCFPSVLSHERNTYHSLQICFVVNELLWG